MTITLLAPDGVALTAQQERQARAAGHGGGSGRQLGGRSGFRIGTPSTVLSATSTTWTLGACAAMIDPGAAATQGMYGWANDANITGAVTAADATYARKDIVYILVNDSTAGDGSGAVNANPVYLAGTASASPVAPTVPPRGFLVGTITVPQSGGGSPTVVRNPAVYVAAGAPLPVSSQAERDALTLYSGLQVVRLDLPGRPTETYDGAVWSGQSWTPYTPSWAGWINLGAGFQSTGSYMMIGPNLCVVRMKLVAGSTGTNLGTASLAVSLPFTSAADQVTTGVGQWLGSGQGGGIQGLMLSNPPSNTQAAIFTSPSGTAIAQAPGAAGFGYGSIPPTEVHATITYRTA